MVHANTVQLVLLCHNVNVEMRMLEAAWIFKISRSVISSWCLLFMSIDGEKPVYVSCSVALRASTSSDEQPQALSVQRA